MISPQGTGDPWRGGYIGRASRPTDANGSFSNPGASGFTAPGLPPISSARNNSGSNVRIPYARLVPFSGKKNHQKTYDKDGEQVGKSFAETDGLESGTIAWIMGNVYDPTSRPGGAGTLPYSRMAHHGLGNGVDRMQRLCTTRWNEERLNETLKNKSINLLQNVKNGTSNALCAELTTYADEIEVDDTLLRVNDVAHKREEKRLGPGNTTPLKYSDNTNAPSGFACGLFIYEEGPFLRGKMTNDELLEITYERGLNPKATEDIPRNLGDVLAFESLYGLLKAQGIFDWSPDGIVLSKLESPSGDPQTSTELDARQARLFNVAVQGPAISMAWCGNSAMQSMPMDRVFVALVATVLYGDGVGAKSFGPTLDDDWRKTAAEFQKGGPAPTACTMSDFRLKPVTASYLLHHSFYNSSKSSSRCGLKIGKTGAEFIIGAWCIGTVLDNAASRATVGNQTRLSPASMALNVNVNVEWWSGDKLYRHYMDVEGTICQRDMKRKCEDTDTEFTYQHCSLGQEQNKRGKIGPKPEKSDEKSRGKGAGEGEGGEGEGGEETTSSRAGGSASVAQERVSEARPSTKARPQTRPRR